MFSQAEKQQSVHGGGGWVSGRERDHPSQPINRSEESCTHWVDYALKGLEAVIHRKHMVLTVCNPSQLRTDRQTSAETLGMDVEGSGKLPWTARAWGTHEQNPEEPGASPGSGPHWGALSNKALTRTPWSRLRIAPAFVWNLFEICLNFFLLGSRGRLPSWMNTWLGVIDFQFEDTDLFFIQIAAGNFIQIRQLQNQI